MTNLMIDNKNESKDWHLIEFYTPIIEFKTENIKEGIEPDFLIRGIAINETTTHNGHKYIAEELQKAANQLTGKKLLVDHDNRVESIKGVISKSWWNQMEKRIEFEGSVKDKVTREMIIDGRLSDVSIGAYAQDLVKEEDGTFIAKGLDIVELSFVAIPADSKANFAMAMDNSFQLKEAMNSEMENEMKKCPECGKMINKDKMKQHMKDKHSSNEEKLELLSERRLNEMDTEIAKVQEDFSQKEKALLEKIVMLEAEKKQHKVNEYQIICTEKKIKAKDTSKISDETLDILIEQLKEIIIPVIEQTKPALKSVINEEVSENIDNIMLESAKKGYAIWAMPDSKGHISVKKW